MRARLVTLLVVAGIVAVPVALIVGGAQLLVELERGAPARATVRDCDRGMRRGTVHCTGTWIVGGDLLAGGRVARGTIDGADVDDVGREVAVRLVGDRAIIDARGRPTAFIAAGATLLAGFALLLRARRRRQDA